MTHIAIQENLGGKVVDWLEKVSDEQYQGLKAGRLHGTADHGPNDTSNS
jgi:hypothetical protein